MRCQECKWFSASHDGFVGYCDFSTREEAAATRMSPEPVVATGMCRVLVSERHKPISQWEIGGIRAFERRIS